MFAFSNSVQSSDAVLCSDRQRRHSREHRAGLGSPSAHKCQPFRWIQRLNLQQMTREIRKAQLSDAAAICTIVQEAFALYLPRMDRTPAPLLADYRGLITDGKVCVVDEEGDVLGLIVAYRRGDNLHVETVAVSPAAQGKRLGRVLMDHAEDIARAQGCMAVELYTNSVMTENLPFYEALGYAVVGRGQEDGFERIFFRKDV